VHQTGVDARALYERFDRLERPLSAGAKDG
jgi:hypothetical protein